jgi:uncharacterized protein (TIGR03435 family)
MALLCAGAWAQPTFEIADVHVSAADATQSDAFLPRRVEFIATTMLKLINTAYNVRADQVVGGPSWLDTDRFDVVADAGHNAGVGEMRTMLQKLLAERFGLELQREEKPMPVYAFLLSRQGVAKASNGKADPDCQSKTEDNVRTFSCRNISIGELANRLELIAPGYFRQVPTADHTGLDGRYDVTLQYVGRGLLPPGSEFTNSQSLFVQLEKQLGVRVEQRQEPRPVLTVARVNRTPTANAPGVAEKLAPPAKFEVADIRPSKPGQDPDADIKNGRILAKGLSLRMLIAYAYNVEEDWVRGEKFIESDKFDIMAKTEPTESDDALRGMLVSLLQDRFHLKVHKEPQPVTVYTLKAVKPRLVEADSSARSTCRAGLGDGGRQITCTNITMAQFAEKLTTLNTGYLDRRVVDLTGIKGAYDLMFTYMPRAQLERGNAAARAAVSAPGSGAVPVPADRPVGLTLFEAIDKQLGLKLASEKHPMPVIVVDHVDRTPTEN